MPAARHILAEHRIAAGASPPPVAGYVAWYDASQITGQADNTALATWPDLSGNSFHLTQGTPANRPTFYSSTAPKLVNGKPAVWFTSQAIATTFSAGTQPLTIIVVSGYTVTHGGNWAYTFGSSNLTGLLSTGTVWGMYAGGNINGEPTVYDGSTHVHTCIYNGTSSSLLADNVQTGAGNVGTSSLGPNLAIGATDIGTSNPMTGLVCELLVYPSVLSGANITAIYNYLKTKWGTP